MNSPINDLHGAERECSRNKCGQKFNNLAPLKVHINTVHPTPSTSGIKRKTSSAQKSPSKRQRNDKNGIYSFCIFLFIPHQLQLISSAFTTHQHNILPAVREY
jgi:hypothetical protein